MKKGKCTVPTAADGVRRAADGEPCPANASCKSVSCLVGRCCSRHGGVAGCLECDRFGDCKLCNDAAGYVLVDAEVLLWRGAAGCSTRV